MAGNRTCPSFGQRLVPNAPAKRTSKQAEPLSGRPGSTPDPLTRGSLSDRRWAQPARRAGTTGLDATVGGASILDPDGIDLLLIEPPDLAVAGFIALPAVGAMAIALLVETGARRAPGAMTGSWVVPPTRLRLAARLCATVLVLVLVVAEGRILVEEIGRIP